MGSRIAGRLLDVGHNVVVWNRTPSKANALVGRGASPVGSPAEAAARVDYLITMIANPEALRAVYTRDHGVLAGLASTTSVIEMSTVGPSSIEWLRSLLPLDIALLDAPVLGSIAQAEAGALTLFVGGPEAAVTKATPLLASLGSIIHAGPLGAGAAAKLVANASLFVAVVGTGEAVALGRGLGLSDDVLYEVSSSQSTLDGIVDIQPQRKFLGPVTVRPRTRLLPASEWARPPQILR